MFDITTAFSTLEPNLFLLSDSVIITVEVFKNIIGVGLRDKNRIEQGQDHSREEQVFCEDRFVIHHPIPIFVLKTNDLADRIIGTGTIYVLHVGAPLGHIHSPISIPYTDGWFGDHGIVRHELKGISRLDLERFLALFRAFETNDGGLFSLFRR